jgi:DNA-binding NarL/FixJ family response regulator
MIRVLIVDDHPIVHDGVAAVLQHEEDIRVVGSAETTARALDEVRALKPDVVLMDLRMPGEEGLSGLKRLLTSAPDIRVLVFTASDADEYVFGAIQAGAKGYVLKGAPAPELIRAIRHVHAGEAYLSPSLGARLVDRAGAPARARTLLTSRQLAILRLVAAGQSNAQIADSLGITERTVKFHVTAIFNRLGADNRAQAVALASRRGLLSIE